MRKKRVHQEANNDRWLVSYADFITLMFAFFVVMYSVSSVNEGKYRAMVNSLQAAFKTSDYSGGHPIQAGQGELAVGVVNEDPWRRTDFTEELPIKLMVQTIKMEFEGFIGDDKIAVREDSRWVEIDIQSDILFQSGKAFLTTQAEDILVTIASSLNKFFNPITVEGFTDNQPISNELYPSNWELSVDRAVSVVRSLIEAGVSPYRLAAVGYGEHYPLVSNDTAKGRERNRRVVILIEKENRRREYLEDLVDMDRYSKHLNPLADDAELNIDANAILRPNQQTEVESDNKQVQEDNQG